MPTIPDGTYLIQSCQPGAGVMDLHGNDSSSFADGTSINCHTKNDGKNQKWILTNTTSGWTIKSVLTSNYASSVQSVKSSDGYDTLQSNKNADYWYFYDGEHDGQYFIHKAADTTRVIDLAGESTGDGAKLIIQPQNSPKTKNQQWSFTAA